MPKLRRFRFSLLLTGALALAIVAPVRAAPASDSQWQETVKASKALVASNAKQQVAFKPMYAARSVVILDDQLRTWGAVQRDIRAFKAENKERGFFVGVAAPAPVLARIGAARKQVARLRALGKEAPVGMQPARKHFAAYCDAVDLWLDASKSLLYSNDQMIFETLEQRALRVASRESQAGVAAMKAALAE